MAQSDSLFSLADLRRILSIIRKNWWILAISLVFGYVIGYLYTYKLPEIYASRLQILLRANDQFNQNSIISDQTYYGSTMRSYVDNSNERRVITSYDLIKTAIEKLNFNVSYFIVGRLKTEEVFRGVPFRIKIRALKTELYEEILKFKITGDNTFELTYTKAGNTVTRKGSFGMMFINEDMELEVMKSGTFDASKVASMTSVEYMVQFHTTDRLVNKYTSALRVDVPEYTNILSLTVEDPIPERGSKFLDTLAQVYIDNSLTSRLDINKNTIFYIDKQMDEVVGILNSIEDTLQDFRERNAILDLDKEGQGYFNQYLNFDDQRRYLDLQLAAYDDLSTYIRDGKDPQFLPPSAYLVSTDAFMSKSVNELYDMQIEENELLSVGTAKNPHIQQLRSRMDSLKLEMLVYIANSRNAIVNRIADLELQKRQSIRDIQAIPSKQRGLTNINRELSVNEEMYVFLLHKRANTIIARAGIIPNYLIIEKGRNIGIVSPNKNVITYYFLAGAAAIGLIIIILRMIFFARIESYDELKSVTHLPIVGEIIQGEVHEDLKIAVEYEPKSNIAESFRTIRTNVQFMLADKSEGIILLTSNNPGEGKTFCSVNLAALLARGGRKVVILELDLHKPRVQKALDLVADRGISTIMIGKHALEECIQPTTIENLDAILSGPIPPNPSEMVVSKKMAELIMTCKERYEFVIIDTPPVGLITDALVLMKLADVSLFVLNTKIAYRNSLNTAHEIVNLNKPEHFGFILNGVKRKRTRYYYNRYGYGYGSYRYGGYGTYGGYGSYGSYGEVDKPGSKKSKNSK